MSEVSIGPNLNQSREEIWSEWAKEKSPDEIGKMLASKEKEAEIDPLSKLLNRRGLNRNIEIFQNIHERESVPISFLYFDIDNFKDANDEWGHEAGDQVIIFISQVMKDASRASDILARTGGDEFVAMLPYTDEIQADNLKKRMIGLMEISLNEMEEGDLLAEMGLSLSIGNSTTGIDEDLNFALNRADKEMYKVKKNSKNG
ncbi:MAG: GGDEF domain-containing protein [Patescibacteria group bacterium]